MDPDKIIDFPVLSELDRQFLEIEKQQELIREQVTSVLSENRPTSLILSNKLIQETESDDARIRIRALELLGKISDVGLFSDKTEVTVTHQTTDDIRDRLRDKLTKLVEPEEEIEDAIIIDVDAELGIKDEG